MDETLLYPTLAWTTLDRSTSLSALLTLLWSYGVCEALLLAMPRVVAVAQRTLLSRHVILGIVSLVRLEWASRWGKCGAHHACALTLINSHGLIPIKMFGKLQRNMGPYHTVYVYTCFASKHVFLVCSDETHTNFTLFNYVRSCCRTRDNTGNRLMIFPCSYCPP